MVFAKDGRSIIVIGSTGTQGSSVIDSLSRSDKPYHVFAVTRDTSKPAAQKLQQEGVDLVQADVSTDRGVDDLFKQTGKDIDVLFGVTNFWEHLDKQKEIVDGKRLVDKAQANGVKLFIWSGLEGVQELTNGKIQHVEHFDSKHEVTKYAQQSGLPTIVVQAGFYASNFATMMQPRKTENGIVFAYPFGPKTVISLVDTQADYGKFVRAALENDKFCPGSELLACAEELTIEDVVKQFNEGTFAIRAASYHQLPDQVFLDNAGHVGPEMLDMFRWFEQYGYYGGKDVKSSQAAVSEPLTSWKEFVQKTDWSSVLA
ncbi:hypothetical protein OIV83_004666 [Microbotryomycetes sp. JL201]|nr:hypothetical protein OIV83_004666 [Microbotryomycetes sp. JL201]